MSAKRHDTDECPAAGAIAAGNFSKHSTQAAPSGARCSTSIREFNHELERCVNPMDLHHPIYREFPEHRETIKRLKGSDNQFRHFFDEYHKLDDEICRIEEDIDFATD